MTMRLKTWLNQNKVGRAHVAESGSETEFPLLYSQCPFMDERILSLHQKIKTQPVDLPEQWAQHSYTKTNIHYKILGVGKKFT